MNSVAKLQEENRILSSRIADLEAENSSLKKLNDWYIEQFKLRQKEKFGRSSEKGNDSDQLSFFDIFNESETLKEPIVIEPKEEKFLFLHIKRKKRGVNFLNYL